MTCLLPGEAMKNTRNRTEIFYTGLVIFILTLALSIAGCNLFGPSREEFDFELLEFPFANPSTIERMAAFGIPSWSGTEPHNGIDLIIYESLGSSRILSPCSGTIDSIKVSENPYSHPANQMILTINIYINSEWTVALVIEPGTSDEWLKAAQLNSVLVREDETVSKGQPVADLLVGEHGYPHLHYMILQNDRAVCAYPVSSANARQIFDQIVRTRPGNTLPDGNICYGEGY